MQKHKTDGWLCIAFKVVLKSGPHLTQGNPMYLATDEGRLAWNFGDAVCSEHGGMCRYFAVKRITVSFTVAL